MERGGEKKLSLNSAVRLVSRAALCNPRLCVMPGSVSTGLDYCRSDLYWLGQCSKSAVARLGSILPTLRMRIARLVEASARHSPKFPQRENRWSVQLAYLHTQTRRQRLPDSNGIKPQIANMDRAIDRRFCKLFRKNSAEAERMVRTTCPFT